MIAQGTVKVLVNVNVQSFQYLRNGCGSCKFMDGCRSCKAESITDHKNSAANKLACWCHKAKLNPEKTPACLARQ